MSPISLDQGDSSFMTEPPARESHSIPLRTTHRTPTATSPGPPTRLLGCGTAWSSTRWSRTPPPRSPPTPTSPRTDRLHRQEGRRRRAGRSTASWPRPPSPRPAAASSRTRPSRTSSSAEQITHSLQYLKTVGVISDDEISGIVEIAEPVGVVCGITPVTNPTSTAIFKSLIALKTRNPDHLRVPPGRPAVLVRRGRRWSGTPPSRPAHPRTASSGSSIRRSR